MIDRPRFTEEEVQSYQVLCDFCSRFLTDPLSCERLLQLREQRDLFKERPFSDVSGTAANELAALLDTLDSDARIEEELAVMRQDYTYLFRMVGVSHTSPYESVYRTDDRTMFGPTTLEVRTFYRRYGIEVTQLGSQPDDHLGFELAFIGRLLQMQHEAMVAGNHESAAKISADIGVFLADHVLVFAPFYLENVEKRAQENFYRLIARITSDLLFAMAAAWDVQPGEVLQESLPQRA